LAQALDYVKAGFPVLPVHGVLSGYCTCGKPAGDGHRIGKHPLTAHGFKDATTDPETITRWFTEQPLANLAFATGGWFWVLETDPRNGGVESLAKLESEHGPLPPTRKARSGGGGTHYYYQYRSGVVIKSTSNVRLGVDVRGDNGYILAPPSSHSSGNRYEWITAPDHPLADPPGWLLTIVGESPKTTAKPSVGGSPFQGLVMGSDEANDFSTHPGAGQGARNRELIRLLGIHKSRGDSPKTIEFLALSWANRCDPPIPERDIHAKLKWIESKREPDRVGGLIGGNGDERTNSSAQREAGLVSSFVDSGDTNNTNKPTPYPIQHEPDPSVGIQAIEDDDDDDAHGWPSLSVEAYHGLAGDIVRAIEPETEADPAAVLISLLTAFGTAVGKSPHYAMGAGSHHTNLFSCVVGDTASGKGQSWSVVDRLMRLASMKWNDAVCYGLSSGEGLVDRLKDPEPDDGAILDTIPEVRLLAIETEFAKPITAMRRDGNTLSSVLRSAWDGQTLEVLTRGKSALRSSNAHVGIIAHITPEEHAKLFKSSGNGKGHSTETSNGFANRFLWALTKRSKVLPEGGDPDAIKPFAKPLRDALLNAGLIERVVRDDAAKALWAEVYESLTSAKAGAYGQVVGRGAPQVLRLSLIYALLDGSQTITADHLRAALAVWHYCDASAEMLFKDAANEAGPEPLDLRLLNAIIREPGISRKGLHHACGNNFKASDLDTALRSLESRRLAHRGRCQPEGGGRPAECWWPGAGADDPDDKDLGRDDTTGNIFAGMTMGGDEPPVSLTNERTNSGSNRVGVELVSSFVTSRTSEPDPNVKMVFTNEVSCPKPPELVSSFVASHSESDGDQLTPPTLSSTSDGITFDEAGFLDKLNAHDDARERITNATCYPGAAVCSQAEWEAEILARREFWSQAFAEDPFWKS
jgi:hypothetical protein